MNDYCVYVHISPNNKKYIGITKQKPQRRWRSNGQGYRNNKYFSLAIKKYGWENFEHKILFENLTQEEAEKKEIELIKQYKTSNSSYGYNLDNGGKTVGTLREETKEKLRKANLGKKTSEETRKKFCIAQRKIRAYEKLHNIKRDMPSGKNNHMYGKHHTEETKQKIRDKNSGQNSAWWGRRHTKEEIEKISNAHKKQIEQLNDNYEVMNTYDSVIDASQILNCKPQCLYMAIRRKNRTQGYYWRFKEVENYV